MTIDLVRRLASYNEGSMIEQLCKKHCFAKSRWPIPEDTSTGDGPFLTYYAIPASFSYFMYITLAQLSRTSDSLSLAESESYQIGSVHFTVPEYGRDVPQNYHYDTAFLIPIHHLMKYVGNQGNLLYR